MAFSHSFINIHDNYCEIIDDKKFCVIEKVAK